MRLLAVLLLAAAAPLCAADPPKTAFQLQKEAQEAYARGDWPRFLKDYEQAARLRPGDTAILYNLACGQALNGQTEAALGTLSELAAHRVAVDLDGDADFDSIRKTDGYAKVVARMETARKERITSGAAVAFTIPEKEVDRKSVV
jgi:hypothetical protein